MFEDIPILSQRQIDERKEKTDQKNKDKIVLDRLTRLAEIEHDDGDLFYQNKITETRNRINDSIGQIKSINYEKAVQIYIKRELARNLLSQLHETQGVFDVFDENTTEMRERIERQSKSYNVEVPEKYQEMEQEINKEFDDINNEISEYEEKISLLQDIILNTDNDREEFYTKLRDAHITLDEFDRFKDELVLDNAEMLLQDIPFSKNVLEKISIIKERLHDIDQIDIDIQTKIAKNISITFLPSEEGSPRLQQREILDEKSDYALKNKERIEYLEKLQPENIVSTSMDNLGQFKAYLFGQCVVLASPFARNALYVVSRDNWKKVDEVGRKELTLRGAMSLKEVPDWKNRLQKIIDGDMQLTMDYDMEIDPMRLEPWGDDPNQWIKKVRASVFQEYPDILESIEFGNIEKATAQLSTITSSDLKKAHLYNALQSNRFGSFEKTMRMSFPEITFSDDKFRIFWYKKTSKEKVEIAKERILDNFPDIATALQENNVDGLAGLVEKISADDLDLCRLSYFSHGQDKEFSNKTKLLTAVFSEIPNIEQVLSKKNKYIDLYRESIFKYTPRLQDAIDRNPEYAKTLIYKTLKQNESSNFKKLTLGLRRTHEVNTRQDRVKIAFPELDWA